MIKNSNLHLCNITENWYLLICCLYKVTCIYELIIMVVLCFRLIWGHIWWLSNMAPTWDASVIFYSSICLHFIQMYWTLLLSKKSIMALHKVSYTNNKWRANVLESIKKAKQLVPYFPIRRQKYQKRPTRFISKKINRTKQGKKKLRKQAHSNILKRFPPKNRKKSDKKIWYFSYFFSKYKLCVLVRTASTRRF